MQPRCNRLRSRPEALVRTGLPFPLTRFACWTVECVSAIIGELLQEKIRDQTNASFDGYSDATVGALKGIQVESDPSGRSDV